MSFVDVVVVTASSAERKSQFRSVLKGLKAWPLEPVWLFSECSAASGGVAGLQQTWHIDHWPVLSGIQGAGGDQGSREPWGT